jgi:hypothetical protein
VDDVVPASKKSIHSAEPIAVLRSERIDLSLGLSNSISGSDRISYDDIFSGISVGALALEKGAVVLVNAY